jgi:DNA-directed RNA polymerase sigma subunit (sigma70/sigma32)
MAIIDDMEAVRAIQQRINAHTDRTQRAEAIAEARAGGWTLHEIGLALGMSRERVRIICKREADRATAAAEDR